LRLYLEVTKKIKRAAVKQQQQHLQQKDLTLIYMKTKIQKTLQQQNLNQAKVSLVVSQAHLKDLRQSIDHE